MKSLEDIIKDKVEEVLVLLEANGKDFRYEEPSVHLEDGRTVHLSVQSAWTSSSTCW